MKKNRFFSLHQLLVFADLDLSFKEFIERQGMHPFIQGDHREGIHNFSLCKRDTMLHLDRFYQLVCVKGFYQLNFEGFSNTHLIFGF